MRIRHCLLPLGALLLAPPLWADAPSAVETQADARFIRIEGGSNFRDAGGYRTADGHLVRRGRFYRSASMANLTPQGMVQLQALRIGSIIDLRSTDERHLDSNNWLALSGQGYWARDYSMGSMNMAAMFGDPRMLSVDTVHRMMAEGYRGMSKAMAPSYRELFARLVAGKGATVVNCTAGKDRTGIATALVLTALGVPYETVREDFLLSNRAARPSLGRNGGSFAALAALPPEVQAALGGVDGSYLDAAFDQMRKDHGSIEGYLQTELGLGPRQLAALRRNLLTR